MAARALVLFDIDGTLLHRAGPHHKMSLIHAVREISGQEVSFDRIPTGGMLDRDLVRLMLREVGAKAADIRRWMPAIIELAQTHYQSTCPALHDRVCPGIHDLLALLRNAQIPAALVTGNLSSIGWRKLEAAGLKSYFEFGAFAEMASTRAGLTRIAIRQARQQGLADRQTVFSLIGDHPNDVQAAKLNGIRSIAVTTGLSASEELAEYKPDVLVPDVRSLTLESLL